jgi:hypothetical protein
MKGQAHGEVEGVVQILLLPVITRLPWRLLLPSIACADVICPFSASLTLVILVYFLVSSHQKWESKINMNI